jgi:hypothetical protein
MKLKKCAKQLIQAKSRFLRGTGEAKRVNMVNKIPYGNTNTNIGDLNLV